MAAQKKIAMATFHGYRRQRGKPGVRNELWIIPTTGCISGELRALAARYHKPYWIDTVRVLEHKCGCSQLGDDTFYTRNILAGLARNPNAGGVLLVSLGCEDLLIAEVLNQIGFEDTVKRVKHVVLKDESMYDDKLLGYLDELAANMPRVREPFPLSDLCVGVQSDGDGNDSSLTANPLVDRFADFLTAQKGTILATSTPKLFGVADAIASRIHNERVRGRFTTMERWFRDYYERHGASICENPSSHEQQVGGSATSEENPLDILALTGSAPITAVLGYGEQIAHGGDVQIAFAPCNDLVASTSLAGSGTQLILFTTGRGSPLATVVPTIKISSNTLLAKRHPNWIDFDAGTLLGDESWDDALNRLVDCVIDVAGGEKVVHEKKNFGEIAIFRDGIMNG